MVQPFHYSLQELLEDAHRFALENESLQGQLDRGAAVIDRDERELSIEVRLWAPSRLLFSLQVGFDNSREAGSNTALRLKERTFAVYRLLIEGNPQCGIARKTCMSRQVVHYHTKILEGKRFVKAHDRRDKILVYERRQRTSEIEEYMAICEIVKKCAKSALPITSRRSKPIPNCHIVKGSLHLFHCLSCRAYWLHALNRNTCRVPALVL